MGVFIDELSTDVRVESDGVMKEGDASSSYEDEMSRRMSDMHAGAIRRRTMCEAFDD